MTAELPETRPLTISRLANLAAKTIFNALDDYHSEFTVITRRAKTRFEQQDWPGMQADAVERLDLYTKIINGVVGDVRSLLMDRVEQKLVWASMKAVYSGLIADRDDWELAETFYNSVTRRIFATVGVDPDIEFVDTDFDTPPTQVQPVSRRYEGGEMTAVITQILADYAFTVPYADLTGDVGRVTAVIETHLRKIGALRILSRTEMAQPIFYRGKAAYLVGRLYSGIHVIPLVLALLNTPQGIRVDAVLLEENDVSILFSFARSYFHVDVKRPHDLILFLHAIMPRKRIAELYISIGFNKHGKTALYRDMLHHMAYSRDQFEIAQGEKGMVMTVFTMPDYDLVLKLIKDRFAYPKRTTHQEVRSKYKLVFRHDRAGRLVDAQEFEHLKFERHRFSAELLAELQNVAAQAIAVTETHVIIKHAYVERRVTPLNLYIHEADEEAAKTAVIEYGNAIKDMAATNIFPGDLWLKNFGVTRHGRVVFYDYDELTWLTDCRFRKMPKARHFDDELAAAPWFTVDENDVFPEEFEHFLGMPGPLREVFMAHHADLLDVAFWRSYQERHRARDVIHFYPYRQERRL
ncbi:MAG: bifunctional isocitrate dehydrogenase kinase/phosphatase [Anaerolineales bacterium]|nr:bifunctional isocitrate dehydrogenase kinase/phosphatase [Anaerolineales bacterium]MCB8991044.1 bifunctional isocitrate dehydrogenase kinase/phosphatase [Ardenticatenaceae bacterium]MCB9004086.1 bifunctional isocitrate dehydrogenase kinase/phosphatase [Ardenticatenaceae bacterium]